MQSTQHELFSVEEHQAVQRAFDKASLREPLIAAISSVIWDEQYGGFVTRLSDETNRDHQHPQGGIKIFKEAAKFFSGIDISERGSNPREHFLVVRLSKELVSELGVTLNLSKESHKRPDAGPAWIHSDRIL